MRVSAELLPAPLRVEIDLPDDLPVGEVWRLLLEEARRRVEENGIRWEIVECRLRLEDRTPDQPRQ